MQTNIKTNTQFELSNISVSSNGMKFHYYTIDGTLLADDVLYKVIDSFFERLEDDLTYLLLMRFKFTDGYIRTLDRPKLVNKKSLTNYKESVKAILSVKAEYYTTESIDEIIIGMHIIPEDKINDFIKNQIELIPKDKEKLVFNDFTNSIITDTIPSDRNYQSWGNLIHEDSDKMVISADKCIYKIQKGKEVSIDLIKGSNTIKTVKDSDFKDNIFIRKMDNTTYYIRDNKILLSTSEVKTNYLPGRKNGDEACDPKIITIDIETVNKDGTLIPYLYSMFDGNNSYSYFTSDPSKLFDKLLSKEYKGYTVYAHNLSRFDIIFIFKYIASLKDKYQLKPMLKDGDIISIEIKSDESYITLRDSYLILRDSLLKLSKTFKCESKGIEPVLISNDNLSPDERYYSQLNTDHYNKEVLTLTEFNKWKKLAIEYCELDCKVLYDVLIKFRELIYDKWRINIENYPTTPSLAFTIFRLHYLNKFIKIPLTKGEIFEFIKKSFTGGATDMYKPYGENIRCYDVNSLYPFQMQKSLFPTGKINKFIGDITILDRDNTFWIGDVDVSTKKDLYQPYLQIHLELESGIRTVSPNGSFSMIINSPEYYNAKKDYDFKIKNGYYFNKPKRIFDKIINDLYTLRKKYSKGDPMNLTCKLLMNSLFGRFAMKPIDTVQLFVNKKEFEDISGRYTLDDYIDLDENGLYVSYVDPKLTERQQNISICIASAITSYARIFMSKFKNNEFINLYYSDTDSIFIDKDLSKKYINNNIGSFKLEDIYEKIIFLGPKVYCGITTDDKKICKIKGFKKSDIVGIDQFKELLKKDSILTLQHDKWIRSMEKSQISIVNQVYNLKKTENKRILIYNEEGIAIDTVPFKINQ